MTMGIKSLQQRLTQVGVIRLGEQRVSQRGKKFPVKLETLRFTSASKQLIDAVAAVHGGEVKAWQAPSGPQWEVVTNSKEIAVLVPPQRIDPNMELWGNGYRSRMCDGETESIRRTPCLCAAAQAKGARLGPNDVCKPTTRMALMLADIPSLGTWRLESHGWNAAAELPTLAASIESAPQPIPARLEVQKREKKTFDAGAQEGKQVESRVFMVPVLHFDWITPSQAFGGELGTAARAALAGAAVERHEIEAAKVESQRREFTADEYLSLSESAEEIDDVRELWRDAAEDGALTGAVKDVLNAKVAEIQEKAKKQEQQVAPQQADARVTPQTPIDVVVDAEVVPDPDAVWAQIQSAAGERGWNSDDLEQRVMQLLKNPSTVADGFELTRFLTAVKAGEVQ
jgi:hypothetical protein